MIANKIIKQANTNFGAQILPAKIQKNELKQMFSLQNSASQKFKQNFNNKFQTTKPELSYKSSFSAHKFDKIFKLQETAAPTLKNKQLFALSTKQVQLQKNLMRNTTKKFDFSQQTTKDISLKEKLLSGLQGKSNWNKAFLVYSQGFFYKEEKQIEIVRKVEYENDPDKMAFNYPNYLLVGPVNSGKTSFIKQIDEDQDLDAENSTNYIKAHKVGILNNQKKTFLVDTFGYNNKRLLRTQDELLQKFFSGLMNQSILDVNGILAFESYTAKTFGLQQTLQFIQSLFPDSEKSTLIIVSKDDYQNQAKLDQIKEITSSQKICSMNWRNQNSSNPLSWVEQISLQRELLSHMSHQSEQYQAKHLYQLWNYAFRMAQAMKSKSGTTQITPALEEQIEKEVQNNQLTQKSSMYSQIYYRLRPRTEVLLNEQQRTGLQKMLYEPFEEIKSLELEDDLKNSVNRQIVKLQNKLQHSCGKFQEFMKNY